MVFLFAFALGSWSNHNLHFFLSLQLGKMMQDLTQYLLMGSSSNVCNQDWKEKSKNESKIK